MLFSCCLATSRRGMVKNSFTKFVTLSDGALEFSSDRAQAITRQLMEIWQQRHSFATKGLLSLLVSLYSRARSNYHGRSNECWQPRM